MILLFFLLGIGSKFYSGPMENWVHFNLGGVFYVTFWILVIALISPKRLNPLRITITVMVITCLLEILQLWHPPFLEVIRSTFIGQALIGQTFSFVDFFYYCVGALLGWWLLTVGSARVNR